MQSVRTVVKNVGNPSPALQVVSPQQADEEIQYNYTSQGYVLHSTHYLGAVPTADGSGIQGYKFAYVFVKNDDGLVPLEEETISANGEVKRRGRPAKAQ